MKFFLAILLLALPLSDIDKIATVNKHKKQAREAYNNGDYEVAREHYTFLVDSMKIEEPELILNLANTYYQLKDTTQAINTYQNAASSSDALVSSVAHQQLGVMQNKNKQYEQALSHFKKALKADPANEDARYNYELLKKVLKEQEDKKEDQQEQDKKDQEQDQKKEEEKKENKDKSEESEENKEKQEEESEQKEQDKEGEKSEENQDQKSDEQKEQEKKDQQEKDQQDGEPQEEGDDQNQDQLDELSEKLKDMKITEEKARMILEAMKNNEIQYFQQNKRKPTKKKDTSKPDW